MPDIRQTVAATKAATFSIELPDANRGGFPVPTGTGFFVSPDGWFITAAHVVTEDNDAAGKIRTDLHQGALMKEIPFQGGQVGAPIMCQAFSVDYLDASLDFALLRVSFADNANKAWLKGLTSFLFIRVSERPLEDGEEVYAFGYPLSQAQLLQPQAGLSVGVTTRAPRLTSAIVSATRESSGPVMTSNDPVSYVLDKALNYGNSGGPIVAVESGHVHAFCSRFQPVYVPQPHIQTPAGPPLTIMVPSLYGIVVSLSNPSIVQELRARGVPALNT